MVGVVVAPRQGLFAPTGITLLPRYYWPFRHSPSADFPVSPVIRFLLRGRINQFAAIRAAFTPEQWVRPLDLRFSRSPVRSLSLSGYISASSWGRTCYEHMLELERRRLIAKKKSPADVNNDVKSFAEFYSLYLTKGMTPGEVIAQHPEWKNLWYDAADGQYGRPAAFYQQLEALNLGEVWQRVSVPVLVIRGKADTIMSG